MQNQVEELRTEALILGHGSTTVQLNGLRKIIYPLWSSVLSSGKVPFPFQNAVFRIRDVTIFYTVICHTGGVIILRKELLLNPGHHMSSEHFFLTVASMAYGSFQELHLPVGLHHRHSNTGSMLHLQPCGEARDPTCFLPLGLVRFLTC